VLIGCREARPRTCGPVAVAIPVRSATAGCRCAVGRRTGSACSRHQPQGSRGQCGGLLNLYEEDGKSFARGCLRRRASRDERRSLRLRSGRGPQRDPNSYTQSVECGRRTLVVALPQRSTRPCARGRCQSPPRRANAPGLGRSPRTRPAQCPRHTHALAGARRMPRLSSCHESHDVWWVGVNSARERSSFPNSATDPRRSASC
jgi:hypothetical protein